MTVLKNARVFIDGGLDDVEVRFDTHILAIGDGLRAPGEDVVDCENGIVLPGGIDPHVHFRDFQEAHKEDWVSGSRASLAGGTTTVMDMPNNRPPVLSSSQVARKRESAGKVAVGGLIYGGIGPENLESLEAFADEVDAFKLYMSSTTGDLAMADAGRQYRALEAISGTGTVVTVHAENTQINAAAENRLDQYDHAEARPPVSEGVAVSSVLEMAREAGCPVHIAHVSSSQGVRRIREAKEAGIDVTAEVCPHHLFLTEEDVEPSLLKVNPPLRSEEDQEALWNGIEDGTIDMVASDHAPHTTEEKEKQVEDAPAGVPGVQERYPLMVNEALEGDIGLGTAVALCSRTPAERFGLEERGTISEGCRADIAVFSETETAFSHRDAESKCGWTPYNGRNIAVSVSETFVAGEPITQEAGRPNILEAGANEV